MTYGIIKLAFGALKINKLRSFLTTLGIIIGTAIVIIVLSLGAGIEALIFKEMETLTPETLYVEVQIPVKGSVMQKNFESAQALVTGVQINTMKLKDIDQIKKIENIKMGYGMTIAQEKMTYLGQEKKGMIFGVGKDYFEMEKPLIEKGRFFTQKEDDNLARVIILGSEVKNKLFGDKDAINKNIKINQQDYKVIGVLKKKGTWFFMNMDEVVIIPIQTVQKKILGVYHILFMGLKMKDKNLINPTIDQIKKIMRKNHGIIDPGKDDFAVRTMDESMGIIKDITNTISILLFAIASISLIVGGVGIMNVMYVAVTERTNEIGLKKAVGAKPFAIRIEFLLEALIISAVGGVIGILFGSGFSWLVSYIANLFSFYWPFVVSLKMGMLAFSIPVFIGIIFGYAPAKKASLMDPIEALRNI